VPPAGSLTGDRGARRVMLATLAGVAFAPGAVELAIDVAREHGARLVVVDVARERARRLRTAADAPEIAPPVRVAADRAAAEGIAVTVVHGPSPRPVATLARTVVAERPCLLVFAPDPAALASSRAVSRLRYRRALRLVERRTACLLWAPAAEHADVLPRAASGSSQRSGRRAEPRRARRQTA